MVFFPPFAPRLSRWCCGCCCCSFPFICICCVFVCEWVPMCDIVSYVLFCISHSLSSFIFYCIRNMRTLSSFISIVWQFIRCSRSQLATVVYVCVYANLHVMNIANRPFFLLPQMMEIASKAARKNSLVNLAAMFQLSLVLSAASALHPPPTQLLSSFAWNAYCTLFDNCTLRICSIPF